MMDQQQRRGAATTGALGDDTVNGRLRGVDRGDDAADQSLILDLEAIDGIALVGDLADPEVLVQVPDEVGQGNRCAVRRGRAVHRGGPAGRSVPAAIASAAALTRAFRVAGTRESRAGLGS